MRLLSVELELPGILAIAAEIHKSVRSTAIVQWNVYDDQRVETSTIGRRQAVC